MEQNQTVQWELFETNWNVCNHQIKLECADIKMEFFKYVSLLSFCQRVCLLMIEYFVSTYQTHLTMFLL